MKPLVLVSIIRSEETAQMDILHSSEKILSGTLELIAENISQ